MGRIVCPADCPPEICLNASFFIRIKYSSSMYYNQGENERRISRIGAKKLNRRDAEAQRGGGLTTSGVAGGFRLRSEATPDKMPDKQIAENAKEDSPKHHPAAQKQLEL